MHEVGRHDRVASREDDMRRKGLEVCRVEPMPSPPKLAPKARLDGRLALEHVMQREAEPVAKVLRLPDAVAERRGVAVEEVVDHVVAVDEEADGVDEGGRRDEIGPRSRDGGQHGDTGSAPNDLGAMMYATLSVVETTTPRPGRRSASTPST